MKQSQLQLGMELLLKKANYSPAARRGGIIYSEKCFKICTCTKEEDHCTLFK